MIKLHEISRKHRIWYDNNLPYALTYYRDFDYRKLSKILYRKKQGRGRNNSYNECFIMADTETSKKIQSDENHVCAWTISIRAYDRNIVTLYGHRPTSFCETLHKMMINMKGEETFVYFHNLAYDWVFLRKFLFREFGFPDKQLNTKPHYPILIKWDSGLTIKDSLIFAQRSLEKWAKDLNVKHQKACGKWEYNKIRNQDEVFTPDELEYIEHDTLAGVECLDRMRIQLNKTVATMPYTATGIPREESRKKGKENHARQYFQKVHLNYEQYRKAERVYHGGYNHANRYLIDELITDIVTCYDFLSSYPFVLLSEKYPSEAFSMLGNKPRQFILDHSEDYAFMFKYTMIHPRLKDGYTPMPALQFSKCVESINAILDNGRVLEAEYIEIYINEQDLKVISEQYECEKHICSEVECAKKEYLPRWFTDYVFQLFIDKTMLKGGDSVAYALAKAKVNSLYGMCVQKAVKYDIEENYLTGDFEEQNLDPEEVYEKYLKKHNTILPYQWGVWCTSYAFYNLFQLGKCCETWVYSDTDSCYGINWDKDKLQDYNNRCKEKMKANGYGCVNHNNLEYWLGIAEYDGSYHEFKVLGAKRYCGRSDEDNKLHITVAGVPKKNGAKCLHNDINEFTKGKVFDGETTGKLMHTYIYVDDIYIDREGNETGDSINLTLNDYTLDSVSVNWDELDYEEIEVQVYE